MIHKRYKTMMIQFACDCGECEGDDVFIVVEENMTEEEFVRNPEDDRILCDYFARENAELIVNALNRLTLN